VTEPAQDLRTFADVREGLADQSRRDSKPFRHECVEDRLERGQDDRLSRLYEHSERSAHSQAALLRGSPADTFVDEQQINDSSPPPSEFGVVVGWRGLVK
jgi:hypothetical protein